MKRSHAAPLLALLIAALLIAAPLAGCDEAAPQASARRVSSRTDLIGGPSALGEIGDYVLENDKIRVVIQDKGFSRGFGVYGGSLIDADLVRPIKPGTPAGGHGLDNFGELFPIFFIEALNPDGVEVLSPGSDTEPARIRVTGFGGDFLSLTKALNQALVNSHEVPTNPLELLKPEELNGDPQIRFSVVYELGPGSRAVRIRVTLTNITGEDLPLPSPAARALLPLLKVDADQFAVPVGFVSLFGAGNHIFAPGYGYDIRFSLEDSWGADLKFPALPGLLPNGLISSSPSGVSYGLFAVPREGTKNFAKSRLDEDGGNSYERAYGRPIGEDTLLIPFIASAFTGVFSAQAPNVIEKAPNDKFTFSAMFVVGDGDVASVMDEVYRIRGTVTGKLQGRVRDAITGELLSDVSVLIYDAEARPVNQLYTHEGGLFVGRLPPGKYTARVQSDPVISDPISFEIKAGAGAFLELAKPGTARIGVEVRDGAGQRLPAKITVVTTIDPTHAGETYRKFLYDLSAGQRWRHTDLIADDPNDPSTLQYIEAQAYTVDGRAELAVPPGHDYHVYVSRGIEYSLFDQVVHPEAGQMVSVAAHIKRVVDTPGYISADFHMHAAPSVDSDTSIRERVSSAAGEGLEFLVATDHNFVTDYQAYIERAGLTGWLSSMIGIELTTLESGHFNAYPLKRDVGAITKGSFEWSQRTPDQVFAALREMGAYGPKNVIVQVNHARDTILGYFSQYKLGGLTGEVAPPSTGLDFGRIIDPSGPAFFDDEGNSQFSYDFDAVEVLNGGLLSEIFHARMPESIEGLEIPEDTVGKLPEPGTVLCDGDEVASAGVADDWFNLLNLGKRYTGTANSDTHHLDDIGFPRTYVRVGRDDPAFVKPLEVEQAVANHQAIMTSGPFLELFVNGAPIGSDVTAGDGKAAVRVAIQAAPWVDVNEGWLIANGERLETFPVAMKDGRFELKHTYDLPRDTWIVAIARGEKSMFPVRPPIDVAPVLLNDAFASIAGPIGLGSSDLGDLIPSRVNIYRPLAITNPIWVDVDGGGFTASGVTPKRCHGFGVEAVPEGENKIARDAPAITKRPRRSAAERLLRKGPSNDVRAIFRHFSGHAH